MTTVDDVIRECGDTIDDVAHEVIRLRDRIRELEARQAASKPVAWALVQRVAVNIRANLESLPYVAEVWADDLDQALAHLSSAAVMVTDEMVNAAARRGRDYGFNAYCDNAQEYWAAMESVVTAALAHPTTPTRGRDA